jgi:Rrf2 family protein
MISQKAKYALRALVALARAANESLVTSDLAERERIPRKFLEQILLELKRDGIVQSRRGKAGGYALLKPADTITFGHVLRLIDGPLAPVPCLSRVAYRRCKDCLNEETARFAAFLPAGHSPLAPSLTRQQSPTRCKRAQPGSLPRS